MSERTFWIIAGILFGILIALSLFSKNYAVTVGLVVIFVYLKIAVDRCGAAGLLYGLIDYLKSKYFLLHLIALIFVAVGALVLGEAAQYMLDVAAGQQFNITHILTFLGISVILLVYGYFLAVSKSRAFHILTAIIAGILGAIAILLGISNMAENNSYILILVLGAVSLVVCVYSILIAKSEGKSS